MKILNQRLVTQIRISAELRQMVKGFTALLDLKNRREFCDLAIENFEKINSRYVIAPDRNGLLFRVQTSPELEEKINGHCEQLNTNPSRIIHTSLFQYCEFINKNIDRLGLSGIKSVA